MAVQRIPIQEFLPAAEGQVLLDVRSPGEYGHAQIPGAYSLPLFTDEERKVVGTAYKQESREQAIKLGLDFFGPKMRKMVEEVEGLVHSLKVQSQQSASSKTVFVYCWRGGMRSGAVAWLFDLYGFKVYTLAGGYKAFRNHVLRSFEDAYPFKILGGFTGSGKTEVLQHLDSQGETVIDLEAIACHKGSAFGSFKMPKPPTQEMFENILSCKLQAARGKLAKNGERQDSSLITHHSSSFIWLEDESQRIGNINLPNALWENMRRSPVVFMEIAFEERLSHLVEEYQDCDLSKLVECTQRIAKRLGPLETKNTIAFLQEGQLKEAFRILLHYYDKTYLKALHNRENVSALLTNIQCQTVTPENAHLLTKYQTV